MKRFAPVLVVAGALATSVAVLAFTEGGRREWGFRAVVVAVGLVGVRALGSWHGAHPSPPAPFRRRWQVAWIGRPLRRRRELRTSYGGHDRVLQLATLTAGDAHRSLRPLLQRVADERLRSAHGVSLADADAARHLAPVTWELVRPDRPAPHDLRAPGLAPEHIDAILTDLEAL